MPETREVWKFLHDSSEYLKNQAIQYNPDNGSMKPVSPEDLPMLNNICGQIRALDLLINLEHEYIKEFYYEFDEGGEENE